jgi:hypothetical protein
MGGEPARSVPARGWTYLADGEAGHDELLS